MLYYIFGTISLILGLIFLKVAIQDKKDGSTFGTILWSIVSTTFFWYSIMTYSYNLFA